MNKVIYKVRYFMNKEVYITAPSTNDVDVLKDRIKLLENEQMEFNRIIASLPKLIYTSDIKSRFRKVSYILDFWKMRRHKAD